MSVGRCGQLSPGKKSYCKSSLFRYKYHRWLRAYSRFALTFDPLRVLEREDSEDVLTVYDGYYDRAEPAADHNGVKVAPGFALQKKVSASISAVNTCINERDPQFVLY